MTYRVLCTSHRGPTPVTQRCFARLGSAGWEVAVMAGMADLSLARNLHLTRCLDRWNVSRIPDRLRAAAHNPSASEADVLLLVDDDMEFSLDDADRLCCRASELGVTHSGVYVTGARTVALGRRHGTWVAGAGFLAIPFTQLCTLASRSKTAHWNGQRLVVFTWSGPHQGEWLSEDYRLCERLGGVVPVADIQVGHVKDTPIYPPEVVDLEELERQLDNRSA